MTLAPGAAPADLRARALAAVEAAQPGDLPALAALGEELRVAAGARLTALSVRCDPAGPARRDEQAGAKEMVSVQEAAPILGISTSYLYKHARGGALPFTRQVGRRVLCSVPEMKRWAERQRQRG